MRKRFVKVVILLVAAVLLSGCPSLFRPDYCEVRFKNDSLDMTILWGIRVGEAEFVGTLRPGDETSYYESPSGTYPVELRDGIGLWAERTLDGFDLGPGNGYTIRVTGGTGSVITYRKEIDWLQPHFMDSDGFLIFVIQAFVVDTGERRIVVDTCVGNDKERPYPEFHQRRTDFLGRLGEVAGVTPADVDYVFCTHFHADHVGWNTRLVNGRWEPTFPNARYIFHRLEFDHYMNLPEGEKQPALLDSIVPIVEAGKAVLVDGAHMIGDHISLEPTPGHTPGHCSVGVATPAGNLVITGDMIHSPAQVSEPQWTTRACADPQQAVATRRSFIEKHAEAGTLIYGSHFPSPTACRFERKGEVHRPVFEQ